jgi:hypothetical protein
LFSKLPTCLIVLFAMTTFLLPRAVLSDNSTAQPGEPGEDSIVRLAVAYQAGFLSVSAAACFHLYSSMGIIASDLSAGYVTSASALDALDQTSLLLTVCQGSVDEITALTPSDDSQAQMLLGRIGKMLDSLAKLHFALVEAASAQRTDASRARELETAVEDARKGVEASFDAYSRPF